MTDLKAAVKRLKKDKEYLEAELDQYDKHRDQDTINQQEISLFTLKLLVNLRYVLCLQKLNV